MNNQEIGKNAGLIWQIIDNKEEIQITSREPNRFLKPVRFKINQANEIQTNNKL